MYFQIRKRLLNYHIFGSGTVVVRIKVDLGIVGQYHVWLPRDWMLHSHVQTRWKIASCNLIRRYLEQSSNEVRLRFRLISWSSRRQLLYLKVVVLFYNDSICFYFYKGLLGKIHQQERVKIFFQFLYLLNLPLYSHADGLFIPNLFWSAPKSQVW